MPSRNQYDMQNPLTQFPQPTYPAQVQTAPGTVHELKPVADHGEKSSVGLGP